MNYFISLICLTFISLHLNAADTKLSSVIDQLREVPASVNGDITFDDSFDVYKDKKYLLNIKTKINANKTMGFAFSERHIEINPDQGMTLLIQGISVQVIQIYYDHAVGKFSVKTETPKGIGEKTLNRMIAKELDSKYRSKLIQAFDELTKLKNHKNLNDAQLVAKTIGNIFTDESTSKIPNFRGSINLGFGPDKGQTLKLGKFKAHIKPKEYISAGITYKRTGDKVSYQGAELKFSKGFEVIDPSRGPPALASINITSMKFDGSNEVTIVYSVGAEEVVLGIKGVISLLKTVSGHPLPASLAECDPVKMGVRKEIDKEIRLEIKKMVKSNYQELLKAGIPPELIALFK